MAQRVMSSLLSWLFPTWIQQPAKIPTDTVVKLSAIENSWLMRSMNTNWSLRFNEVLDTVRLQQALEKLITTGPNWRKLGGRFRLDENGHLELHIPAGFTSSRPPVQFTSEEHNMSINQNVLNEILPSNWERPCIIDFPERFDDILAGPNAPVCFKDWIYTDRPVLAVHVINFQDATFITLTYSHSLIDGVGKLEIMLNWCKVLAGRMEDVTPMAAFDDDPFRTIVESSNKHSAEAYLHEGKRLMGWQKYYWLLRMIGYLFRFRNRRQRNLVIPSSTVMKIREEAERTHSDDYLSDNQLITAWLVRMACSPLLNTNRPIGISSAVDLRGFQLGEIQPKTVYLQNLLTFTWTNIDANLLFHQPLGVVASQMRSSLKEQLSIEQVEAGARLTYNAMARRGTIDLYTDKNSLVVTVSSLAKAKY
ncbi:uncharacterized protein RCO7_10950 [Rhynchosporium graminicola]|uniref:Uncharacterized protein n=1 Tax=Rhynchosporium graminicola TaxID=2792576 RepID=A0A1E1KC75_9HELO|nr:uncharacterized protein RCO7_10950 [Rhynchosporium commune]